MIDCPPKRIRRAKIYRPLAEIIQWAGKNYNPVSLRKPVTLQFGVTVDRRHSQEFEFRVRLDFFSLHF